jgi:phage FluMu protein Com
MFQRKCPKCGQIEEFDRTYPDETGSLIKKGSDRCNIPIEEWRTIHRDDNMAL